MLIRKLLLEGIGLGALLVLVCAAGIRRGAVGMLVIAAALSGIMTIFLH